MALRSVGRRNITATADITSQTDYKVLLDESECKSFSAESEPRIICSMFGTSAYIAVREKCVWMRMSVQMSVGMRGCWPTLSSAPMRDISADETIGLAFPFCSSLHPC